MNNYNINLPLLFIKSTFVRLTLNRQIMRHLLSSLFLLLGINSVFAQDKTNLSTLLCQPDKVTYLVNNDNESETSCLLDILQKYPYIAVDEKGAISLNGSPDFGLSIDGQPCFTNSSLLFSTLRNMPARFVEKVEIITKPSFSQLMSCSAGVINIVTKKSKKDGIETSVGGIMNSNGRFGGSVLFNMERPTASLNGSCSANFDNSTSLIKLNQKNNSSLNLGADKPRQLNLNYALKISKNDMFSVSLNLINHMQVYNEESSYLADASSPFTYFSHVKYDNQYINIQTAYNHKFQSIAALFSLKYCYSKYISEVNFSNLFNDYNVRLCEGELTENDINFFVNSEFSVPLGKNNRFLVGAKYSNNKFVNNVEEYVDVKDQPRIGQKNAFDLKDKSPLLYFQYDLTMKRFLLSAMARYEKNVDNSFKEDYHFLPSINMMYKLSSNSFVHADFGSYFISNKDLLKRYSNINGTNTRIDRVRVGYNFDKNKLQLMFDASYSSWTSFSLVPLSPGSEYASVILLHNSADYDSNKLDLSAALSYRINSKIKLQLSSNLGYFDEKLNSHIKTGFVGNVVLSSWIKMPYGISLNANGGYYFPRNDYYTDSKEYYTYRFRLTRNFFSNKLVASLYTNNLFTTDNVQLSDKIPNLGNEYHTPILNQYYKQEGHEVGLSMVYHF